MREVVKRRAFVGELSTTLAVSKPRCHRAQLSTATRPGASLLCNFLLISGCSFLSLVPFRCPPTPLPTGADVAVLPLIRHGTTVSALPKRMRALWQGSLCFSGLSSTGRSDPDTRRVAPKETNDEA